MWIGLRLVPRLLDGVPDAVDRARNAEINVSGCLEFSQPLYSLFPPEYQSMSNESSYRCVSEAIAPDQRRSQSWSPSPFERLEIELSVSSREDQSLIEPFSFRVEDCRAEYRKIFGVPNVLVVENDACNICDK